MTEKIAVIGMGQMGSGMARRLRASGHDVRGYDLSTQTRQALRNEGFPMADSAREAVAGRDIVLTSLPDPAAVRAAWLGEGGLVEVTAKGTLVLELSTIDPNTMREVGAAAAAKGIDVIDCPVSGGPNEAANGTMVLICGGDEAAMQRA